MATNHCIQGRDLAISELSNHMQLEQGIGLLKVTQEKRQNLSSVAHLTFFTLHLFAGPGEAPASRYARH